MSSFFKWVVYSSKNPQKISLAVKGFLLGIVPVLVTIFGLMDIQLDNQTLTLIINEIVTLINTLLTIVASATFVYGTIRKIVTTFKGENGVINSL